nr:ABC transporter ATP-binding protein [Herpetosiphon giganteus]
MPFAPPLVEVARHFNWQPLPLTIKQGRAAVRQQPISAQPKLPITPTLGAELLRAEALDARYAEQPALRDVDLRLHAGEILAIMGRNGSGKTTLLRHLVGLQQPTKGRVLLLQQPIANRAVEQLAQQIGFVPQNPSDILFHPSLEQELAWTLKNHGQAIEQSQIEQTLQRLNLLHLRERHPRDLSGGEAQRAAFAAIVVAKPQILLLDEPTRGLDYAAKQQLATFLQALASEQHGIIVVTHDVEFVALCAQRVVLLGEGEVVVEGTPQVVLGDSLLFSTQVGKLFPKFGWLSVADVLAGTQ